MRSTKDLTKPHGSPDPWASGKVTGIVETEDENAYAEAAMERHPAKKHSAEKHPAKHRQICAVTGRHLLTHEVVPLASLRPALIEMIAKEHPAIGENAVIGRDEADAYRARYVEQLLEQERGALGDLERRVLASLANRETIAENADALADSNRTIGERAADRIAYWGGSWAFILLFIGLLCAWMLFNARQGGAAFDPFPFILLNLILSCIAALQAPIIMMSQRRQEAKDRMRAENDYRINLKAELEIRALHEKVDHIVTRQWQRLAEIQSLQIELLRDLAERRQA
jgi:uncharacterized membrane protein